MYPRLWRTHWRIQQPFAFIVRQSAQVHRGGGRLDASIGALAPAGGAATITSLGGSLVPAPAGSIALFFSVATFSLESASVTAALGFAESHCHLYFEVEEFTPDRSSLIRVFPGPITQVYDVAIPILGINLRIAETNRRDAFIQIPVIPGNNYRPWVHSLQFVNAAANASAASNFTFDFGALVYSFIQLD